MNRKIRGEQNVNYRIIRHNSHTGQSLKIKVVRGLLKAEIAIELLERKLSAEDKRAGWGHFLERTTEPVTEIRGRGKKH